MALAASEIKHGMLVVAHGQPGQWEVLDRHPGNKTWWLHRRNAAGDWETTSEHQQNMHRVADGSRYEYTQPELGAAA